MKIKKSIILGFSFMFLSSALFAQKNSDSFKFEQKTILNKQYSLKNKFALSEPKPDLTFELKNSLNQSFRNKPSLRKNTLSPAPFISSLTTESFSNQLNSTHVDLMLDEKEFFFSNRRNRYSSLWAFTSLNYLYADLIGLMDKNVLNQYQTGTVDGIAITPKFLTIAGAFMQIPLANVFLPQLIKNERTLRWVQIASGTLMSLVQSATLFVGKPSPYYLLFSAIEIGTTAYITIDAIKWKAKKKIKTL